MVLAKLFGFALILAGLYLVIALPSLRNYMPDEMARVIVLIGIIMTGVGIFLVVKS